MKPFLLNRLTWIGVVESTRSVMGNSHFPEAQCDEKLIYKTKMDIKVEPEVALQVRHAGGVIILNEMGY